MQSRYRHVPIAKNGRQKRFRTSLPSASGTDSSIRKAQHKRTDGCLWLFLRTNESGFELHIGGALIGGTCMIPSKRLGSGTLGQMGNSVIWFFGKDFLRYLVAFYSLRAYCFTEALIAWCCLPFGWLFCYYLVQVYNTKSIIDVADGSSIVS